MKWILALWFAGVAVAAGGSAFGQSSTVAVAASGDRPPYGWLDRVSNAGEVSGWALDPDSPQAFLEVHLYIDGAPGACGAGCRVFSVRADLSRPDVNEREKYPGNHGYLYRLPDQLLDGQQRTVRAYALNAQAGGRNPELLGSPKFLPQTRFGIYYATWHCVVNKPPRLYDTSKALRKEAPWGPVPEFHWWDEPEHGYYCLSTDVDVLRDHAVMLRDAGIDFVFLDASNHAYARSGRPQAMILDPLDRLLETWSQVRNAPKVVAFVPVPKDGTMIDAMLTRLRNYPGLQFKYLGKPLVLVVDRQDQAPFIPDQGRLDQLGRDYTVRKMWGLSSSSPSSWSFQWPCRRGFKQSGGNQSCGQRVTTLNGKPEHISVTTAYQETFISYKRTAVPRFQGRTFVKQFETVFNNRDVRIATIVGWNEWIAQRFCLDASGNLTGNPKQCVSDQFPDGEKIFVHEYDQEYSRSIEPAKNEMGDAYYRLMKACISMFRKGQRCSTDSVPPRPTTWFQ